MFDKKFIICLFIFLFCYDSIVAQMGFSHELGVIAGPVALRSDFGERGNFETNAGNAGYGVGLVHYINFSYRADCNCYTTDNFYNDHVKLRTEISYNKTKLKHLGKWVDNKRQGEDSKRLRAHTGEANNLDIGMQFELYFNSIRSFQAFGYRFNPYISAGAHFTSFSPKVYTTYGDGKTSNLDNFYSLWSQDSAQPITTSSGSTYSFVWGAGVRYKLTMLSDLLLDLRWQYFGQDWIDGLNHNLESNKTNDWLNWLTIGYVYYL